jgi:hypothetical protein
MKWLPHITLKSCQYHPIIRVNHVDNRFGMDTGTVHGRYEYRYLHIDRASSRLRFLRLSQSVRRIERMTTVEGSNFKSKVKGKIIFKASSATQRGASLGLHSSVSI